MATAGRLVVRASRPPAPSGARTVDELTRRLRELQAWAGMSYREIHREVLSARVSRGVPERPVLNTVYRCFQTARSRLDVELVVDIAAVLLGDSGAAAAWRQACQVVLTRADAAAIVDVADRLPEDLATFTGRNSEIERIIGWAAAAPGGGAIEIEGMAGVGKTQLATHAGHALMRRGHFADLQLAVDLRGYDPDRPPVDPAAVLEAFLRRLGARGDQIAHLDLAGRTAKYRQLLAGKRVLILLDNAGSAEQVRPLLPETPGAVALITSRESHPGLPGVSRLRLDVFTPAEAGGMLRGVAGERLVDADPDAATGIAEILGHLPLALGLVAARIRHGSDWTLADHLDRLVQRRAGLRLEGGVEVAVGLSYEELSPDLRRTFRLMALHPGGDLEAYAAAALADTDLANAQQHLKLLASTNLLQPRAPGRYGFHDLIRIYATNRAHDEESARSRRAALTRLYDHYVYTAALATERYTLPEMDRGPGIPAPALPTPMLIDRESATGWLAAERINLIAAATHAADNGWPIHTSRMSTTLYRYLQTVGHVQDTETLHTVALQAADPVQAGRELNNLGRVHWMQGRYDDALDRCQRALIIARETGDRLGQQRAAAGLGVVCRSLGRNEEALAYDRQAVAIARETGDRAAEGRAVMSLGFGLWRLGRYSESFNNYKEALSSARDIGDRLVEGMVISNLGQLSARLGDSDSAQDHYQQAIRLHRELGNRNGLHIVLGWLGELRARLGNLQQAVDLQQQALSIACEICNRKGESRALANLGAVYAQLGRPDEGVDCLRRALAIAREIADRTEECHALMGLGSVCIQLRRDPEALTHHREALALSEDLGDPYEQARAHDGLGQAMLAGGDEHGARTHWLRALELFRQLGVPDADEIAARLAGHHALTEGR